jgi:hypothetical protein
MRKRRVDEHRGPHRERRPHTHGTQRGWSRAFISSDQCNSFLMSTCDRARIRLRAVGRSAPLRVLTPLLLDRQADPATVPREGLGGYAARKKASNVVCWCSVDPRGKDG